MSEIGKRDIELKKLVVKNNAVKKVKSKSKSKDSVAYPIFKAKEAEDMYS